MTEKVATASCTGEEKKLSPTAERFCRWFSLAEIQLATGDFSDAHLVGTGGFGKVYKGHIDNGREAVAIKRLAPNSNQGAPEFLTEIETLSKLRHINLVPLIGYCNENGEMILVYEYIARGTLADHLHKLSRNNNSDKCSSLTWKQRLIICIGVGRGIDYLHTGTSIIHRDVKSTNILLDENFNAKVSDFGLAKHLSASNSQSHVSTAVKGSFGYLDPCYFTTSRLTKKSDTYAFGVVLLEVLSGRPAVDNRLVEHMGSLVAWAQEKISKGKVNQIVASNLRDEISADCLKTFVGVAKRCLYHEQRKRPTMAQNVVRLEFALEQQDRKAPTRKSPRILPLNTFWIRVKPFGSTPRDHYQNNLPTADRAIQEDVSKDKEAVNMIPVAIPATPYDELEDKLSVTVSPIAHPANAVDESDHKQTVSVLKIAVPAIPLHELMKSTNYFSPKSLIGEGSKGRVYHGVLKSGKPAAVKLLHYSPQRNQELLAQVCSLKHENVVQLLGYCMNGGRQFLAYEFAPNGTLYDILHGQRGAGGTETAPVLTWAQRVKFAIGAAEGLKYIHQKAQIHGDIKSGNILLFNNYEVAKIADAGVLNQAAEMTRRIPDAGAFGYYAPEYEISGEPSGESDVYSFGVILLELLTGCTPFDNKQPVAQQLLVKWAVPLILEGKVERCIDFRLKREYPLESAVKMSEIAALCVQDDAHSRPNMSTVVQCLLSLSDPHSPSEAKNCSKFCYPGGLCKYFTFSLLNFCSYLFMNVPKDESDFLIGCG